MSTSACTARSAARAQAEQALRTRDDVLALATHDLRAPLAAMRGHAQLVQWRLQRSEPVDVAWLAAQMRAIDRAIGRMTTLIDELSDVARLEIGQALDLHVGPVDLGALVHAVVFDDGAGAEAGRVEVQTPAEAVLVQGDHARLRRVLHNLIGNALKYSAAETRIHVTVQRQDDQAVITVRDEGIGIPADDLPHIFTRYVRAANAERIGGTGIGLWGSKAIVEQHGGQLTLVSVLGQGTTVTLQLPCSSLVGE